MMDSAVECIFCKELHTQDNILMENELFSARRDQIPANPGHAEVIPKRHVQYFEDLTAEELAGLLPFAKKVMQQIKADQTKMPDAFTIGINDGPAAGQTIPHLHLHLIPRWKGDVENPKGGIRRIFPEDSYSNS
jgi:diadenosine tetraphosphate (Ap4A) HIT family hydrolase